MKIYPIVSFKSAPFKQDIKKKETLPQINPIEENALEILSNYSKAGLNLSFKGNEVSGVKQDIREMLSENENLSESGFSTIYASVNDDDDIAQIQYKLLKALLNYDKFHSDSLARILTVTKSNKEIAQIQSDVLLELAQNDKFSTRELEKIYCAINKSDLGTAQIQKHLAQKLSSSSKMSEEDIVNIICHLESREEDMAKIVASFVFDRLDDERFNSSDIANIAKNINPKTIAFYEDGTYDFYGSKTYKDAPQIQYDFIKKLDENGLLDDKNVVSSLGLIIEKIKTDDNSNSVINLLTGLKNQGFLDNELISKDPKSIFSIVEYTMKRPEADIFKVLSYMKKIDFEKLANKAPLIKTFDFNQYLTFSDFHLRTGGKTEFKSEDLILKDNLSDLVTNSYVSVRSLKDIFSAFPMTKKEVGTIPVDWLSNVPENRKEEAIKEIYEAISDFQKERYQGVLEKKLSQTLGKKVHTKYLNRGVFGIAYKLEIDGAKDTCLKIFVKDSMPKNNEIILCRHGEHIEVQMGLFANNYAYNFVKMYFGRVSPGQDEGGFLVTQYLDDTIEPDNSVGEGQKGLYSVQYTDRRESNIIQEKIIDYGGIYVMDNLRSKRVESYDVFKDYFKIG